MPRLPGTEPLAETRPSGSALTPIEAIALAEFVGLGVLATLPALSPLVLPAPLPMPAEAPAAPPAIDPAPAVSETPQAPACSDLPGPAADPTAPAAGPAEPPRAGDPAPLPVAQVPAPDPAPVAAAADPIVAPPPAESPATPGPDWAEAARAALAPLLALAAAPGPAAPGWLQLLFGGGDALIAGLGHAPPAAEPAPPVAPPPPADADGLDASLAITATFLGGFRAEVTLTATRDVTDWEILLETGWTIRHVSGATLHAAGEDGLLRLEDAGWNGTLSAGQSVTIGLVGVTGQDGVADAAAILDALWLL